MATAQIDPEALAEAFTLAGVACWVWDAANGGRPSDNLHLVLGGPAGEFPDRPEAWLKRIHHDEVGVFTDLLDKIKLGSAAACTVRIRHANGVWRWFEIRAQQAAEATESAGRLLLTLHDITQQKQSEAALRDSQIRYRALYATSPLAFVLWDRQGRISEWNQRAEAIFGWPLSEVIGKPVHRLLLPENQRDAFSLAIKALTNGSGNGNFSGPTLSKDGQLRECAWYNVALRATNGSLIGILSLILDGSEQHLAQQALEKSEKTYRTLVETSPDAILLLGLDGRINMANQQAQQLFGLSDFEDVGSNNLSDLLPATEDRNAAADFLKNPEEYSGFIVNHEFRMRRRDGETFDAAVAFTTTMDAKGDPSGMVLFARDITARLAAERDLAAYRDDLERLVSERTAELEATRCSLAQIIDGSPVPTLVLDADHRITQWNAACENVTGITAEAMIGTNKQWQAFYNSARPTLADAIIDGISDDHSTSHHDTIRPSRVVDHGSEGEAYFPKLKRWLFFTAAPLFDRQGRVIGAIETLQDVSERKEAEAALIAAKGAAEQAAMAKASFLANMSHEIRTPINAVIGLTHLLGKSALTTKQSDYLTRISGASQMLLGLVSDILDFSKIEAGQMQLEVTDFKLDDVLEKVSSIVQIRAQEKALELHYVRDSSVPTHLRGDPLRLIQILVNLLGNAIKFTDRGSVSVYFTAKILADAQIRLEVAVKDSGIGVTPDQLGKLFQAFSQADSSTTRKFGGTGLGLTICKRLCELMGGEISASSEAGIGSTFSFYVMVAASDIFIPPEKSVLRRVLVVDDNFLAREVLAQLLEKSGCQVLRADSGEQALKLIAANHQTPFDCITIDLNMPDMNGIELAEGIQRLATRPLPRLVMVTAANTDQLEESGDLAGFEAILYKPVTATQIATLLACKTQPGAAPANQASLPLAGLRVLLVEDIEINQLIASEILESFGVSVETANNGRIALEKLAAAGQPFDLVLMDVQMPEMDGIEATRRIRAGGQHADLPIIAMTAHAFDEERKRCQEVGMNDFLSKPVDPAHFHEVLLRWKPKPPAHEKNAPKTPLTAAGTTALPVIAGLDMSEGLRLMMNKPRLYERVLREFHQRFKDEARRIAQAIDQGDLDQAKRLAHSVKGLAGSIGALELQAAAQALELASVSETQGRAALAAFEPQLKLVIGGIAAAFNLAP